MKITNFSPLIVTKDAAALIELFEALGFEKRHKKTGINDEDISSTTLKYTNEDGKEFYMTVSQAPVPQDMASIRMNVRDFDEAYKLFLDNGFKNAQGDRITETGTSKSTMLIAPSGFTITVTEHIKKD